MNLAPTLVLEHVKRGDLHATAVAREPQSRSENNCTGIVCINLELLEAWGRRPPSHSVLRQMLSMLVLGPNHLVLGMLNLADFRHRR